MSDIDLDAIPECDRELASKIKERETAIANGEDYDYEQAQALVKKSQEIRAERDAEKAGTPTAAPPAAPVTSGSFTAPVVPIAEPEEPHSVN